MQLLQRTLVQIPVLMPGSLQAPVISGHHELEKQWISEGSGRRGMKKQSNKVKRNLVHRGRISESHS